MTETPGIVGHHLVTTIDEPPLMTILRLAKTTEELSTITVLHLAISTVEPTLPLVLHLAKITEEHLTMTGPGASIRGDLGGWSPPFAGEKTKNWDIFKKKIVKFHKNTKFGAFVGHFFRNSEHFGTILPISRILYKIPKFGRSEMY